MQRSNQEIFKEMLLELQWFCNMIQDIIVKGDYIKRWK